MDETNESTGYPTDYIDIVNEINDFIASLDAPPLDNHTKELVGSSERRKFGQHCDASFDMTASRSRHASGEHSTQLSLANPQDDSVSEDVATFPFPVVEDVGTGYGIYDNKALPPIGCEDYSDVGGVYSDSGSSCCDGVADSDSGCYSHYHHVGLASSYPTIPQTSSSLNTFSGTDRSQAVSSSSPRHHQQHLRPQSPDRLSAEFHCDLDPVDQRFHQVGSSAHTLAASSGQDPQAHTLTSSSGPDPNNFVHQRLTDNTSNLPKSLAPKRRSPPKLGQVQTLPPSSPDPLSTFTQPHSTTPCLGPSEEDTYTLIQKPSLSCQKVSIKNRWPPPPQTSAKPDQQNTDLTLGKLLTNQTLLTKSKPALKECQTDKQQADAGSENSGCVAHVPDLSVLISELRSASPQSQLSPSHTYTTTARSQSISPKPHSQFHTKPDYSQQQCPDPPRSPIHQPHSKLRQTKQGPQVQAGQSTSCSSKSDSQSVNHKLESQPLSPSHKQHINGVTRKSDSPEHDYEPIENLQLEVTGRPQTKPSKCQSPAMADPGALQPKHVKALHNFKGANNDELCFKRGDIITVTQCLDGGWWEGTLNGRTGWFPSNYTKEVKADISYKNNKTGGEVPVPYKRESMQLYHNVVLKNVIETEKTHVSEMIKVLQSYIKPLESTNLLTATEYSLLVGNVEEIIAFQQSFLAALEECERLPSSQRRIGGIFMQFAPKVKELYSAYCANHPKAVSVLQKKREELGKFVENQGAPVPGAQTLTTILSKPFTRLDRYPSLLKELERHVEESHPDRGDTQRAIAVYRTIANSCLEIRKLKEMEFEIITSTIQGWEGEEISKLGEVIHLSQVKMITQTGEKYERIFVLFSSCLVMLSMSARLSSYQYEGKIPLTGLAASPCESPDNFQNAFEISGPMIEKITVLCGTKVEVTSWLEVLNQQLSQSGNPATSSKPQPLQVHMTTTCQTSVSTVTPAKIAQITSNPPTVPPPQFPLSTKTSSVWSMSCLRPSPPLRPTLMCREEVLKSPRAGRKSTHKRKPDDSKVYNEDAYILQVIEAYCNSIKTRHTVNSCRIEVAKNKPNDGKAILTSPQILLVEEEKIFDESEQQERTVVDTVYALQDRVKELEQEQRKLRQDLDEEKRCRKKLEILLRQQIIKSSVTDGLPQDDAS